jgi:transposase
LKPLGEDIAEQLEIITSAFKVIRTIRKKKTCACCDVIVQAPAPRPIERGIAGPGLLAHILGEVCRPYAAVPTIGDLRASRR